MIASLCASKIGAIFSTASLGPMVFFAITRKGYEELVALLGGAPSILWVNLDVLSGPEIAELEFGGVNVTPFSIDVTSSFDRYMAALDTIWQHHQGERLWAEYFVEA